MIIVCALCQQPFQPGQNTERRFDGLYHEGCLADLMDAETEIAQVQEATK